MVMSDAEFVDHDGQQAYKFAPNPTCAHPLLLCGDSEWPCQLSDARLLQETHNRTLAGSRNEEL
jgi:hypothetical protein